MYREAPGTAPLAVVSFGPHVFGMDRSGRQVWHFDGKVIDSVIEWTRLIITDQHVVLGSRLEQALVCLSYATGAKVWHVKPPIYADECLLVDGEHVLIGGGGEVCCHSLADGRLLWHEKFNGMGGGRVAIGFPGNVENFHLRD